MRILVEPNAHHLLNLGDVAMLQIAVERLEDLWPDATIEVITDAPDLLARYCPRTSAVPAIGRNIWFEEALISRRLQDALPARVGDSMRAAEVGLRQRWPRAARYVLRAKRATTWTRSVEKGASSAELDTFLDAVLAADLVLVSGAGAITDPFAPVASTILDLLDLAIRRRTPTAMMGQGIGPIENVALLEQARSVLPRVDLIGLREELRGGPLLTEMGVAPDRIFVTGDDAVELAYREGAAPTSSRAIGINVRVARYSGLDDPTLDRIRTTVQESAAAFDTRLIGIPISRHPNERDDAVADILQVDPTRNPTPLLVDPVDVIRRIRDCRVVVTGSYHAAVFALAQGVPTVVLVASEYYRAKFEGLIELFPVGCRLIDLDRTEFPIDLRTAIAEAWESGDEYRVALRQAAASQIEQSREAYRSIPNILRR